MQKFSRSLKMVGVITLFFFTWVYLPLFQLVAFAATQENQGAKAQSRKAEKQGPAEKLERLLDDLSAITSKAEEKSAKGADATSEVESIKARKAGIDAIDTDLRKDFSATEQKLKTANLSKEVLTRHYKFVKHYEDSLAELKANLDAIEKTKTPSALTSELAKTQKHLAKTKPPKKRKPFDPNKLPNKARLVKHATQEEKKPEEKKILPMQPLRKGAKLNPADEERKQAASRPIIVASNGPLDGLVSASSQMDVSPWDGAQSSGQQLANLTTDSVIKNSIIAAPTIVTHPPASAADLAETPEIQFTPAIKAKAQELEGKPVKIYEWVRNNIEFVPTYGSIQGADMCLQTKQCNDIDTASLLIALLRASNISARYVSGTLELPIEKAKNWLGGVTDPMTVGTILATNGIPVKLLISGGTITAVQFSHVWVNAWINYIPSRGAVHRFGYEDTWIPLDGSYKQYNYTQGIDIASAVPFDAQTFVNQIQSTATINQTDGSVTNVNSSLIQQTMQDYQTQVQNYIQQNYPNATVGDVIGKKEIKKQEFPFLLGTLPYKTVQVSSEFAQVPDNLRETISFSIPDPSGVTAGLSYTTGMPQIAGKKITLSFSPATATDQAVIESYLPKPHSDGTPIQPSELPSSLPAYLINLKPELRLDGQVVATGSSTMMGSALSFTMMLNEPGIGVSNVDNVLQAGEYYGIGLDTGKIGDGTLNSIGNKLAATKEKLDAKNYTGLTEDDLIGDLLYNTIASYFAELDGKDEITAMSMGIVRYRAPSIGTFSLIVHVQEVFGIPIGIRSKGMMMDVDRVMQSVFAKDGNLDNVKQYMLASGSNSSVNEHAIPEQLFSTPNKSVMGISAAKALQIANSQGTPIFTINQSNVNATLPQLQVDSIVKADVQNAVNAGKAVTISKTNIGYNGWTGCGYIIIDPSTGAGAYMISGGANGGMILEAVCSIISHFLITEAEAAELGDTYITQMPVPVIQPPCNSYFHASEFGGCVLSAIASTAFLKGVLAVLGAVAGGFVWAQFFGAPVLYIVGIVAILAVLAVLGSIMMECRKTATHCDPGH